MGRSAVEAHAAAVVERQTRREVMADIVAAADEINIAGGQLVADTSGFASRDEGVIADDVAAARVYLDRLRNLLQAVEGNVEWLIADSEPVTQPRKSSDTIPCPPPEL